MNMFLTPDEVSQLTDRRQKSLQIEALRQMGIPFFINVSGRPVVPSSAVIGSDNVIVKQSSARGWDSNKVK